MADLRDRGRVGVVDGERRSCPPGPVDEQVDRVVLRQRLHRRAVVSPGGDGSDGTRQATSPATPSGSRLVASIVTLGWRRARCRRTRRTRRSGARSCRGSPATTASPSSTAATSGRCDAGVSATPSALSVARPTDARAVVPASSTNHTPPGNALDQLGPHRQRQPRLAHTGRPGQRDQPLVRRAWPPARRSPSGAPDQRRQLHRQVLTERVQRQQRRELGRQIGVQPAATPVPDDRGP